MSLTSQLRSKDSWVNQFFKNELGKATDFAKRQGPAVKALPLKIPLGAHRQAALVGIAFDYRVRLHLGANLGESKVLNHGITRMQIVGSGLGHTIDYAWAALATRLLREPPVGDELTLARASVVLAWLDAGFRSGGGWSEGMRSIAESIDRLDTPDWHHFSAPVHEDIASEVSALYRIAQDQLPGSGAICGPNFAGSLAVGGADADLIVENCLYDIKTTVNPRSTLVKDLRQLIGYALLDWDSEYGLDQVGFFYARQAVYMTWPLSELMVECTGGREPVDLGTLRGRFRALAASEGGH